MPLPSEKEEVWRYSPIDTLDLDAHRPAIGPDHTSHTWEDQSVAHSAARPFVDALVRKITSNGGPGVLPMVTLDGFPSVTDDTRLPEGLTLGHLDGDAAPARFGEVVNAEDPLVRLNDAFLPGGNVVDVAPRTVIDTLILIVHWSVGANATEPDASIPAAFPRTLVHVGKGSQVRVVEVMAGATGGGGALVVPVTELVVEDEGRLSYVSLQILGDQAWNIATVAADVQRDATLRVFTVGLGGAYARTRVDAAAAGKGAHCELRSAYVGTGNQIHDIRTLQDHQAPNTTSDLLCMGAVADTSRSVYSGLIRVRNGAVRTNAMQTNHNLVLDERAHADSVPNLDIEENDVRCSHASTVGPIDEDQRYYLESKGVPPERAERLIVLGFFDDIVDRSPVPEVAELLRQEVGVRLASTVGVPHLPADESVSSLAGGNAAKSGGDPHA